MDTQYDDHCTNLPQIVLIYDTSTMILNQAVEMQFKHHRSFKLLWIVCELIQEESRYSKLGGAPTEDVLEACHRKNFSQTRRAINSRWHREIEFRRGKCESITTLYNIRILRKDIASHKAKVLKYLREMLQKFFLRKEPPWDSNIHHRCKLFSVAVPPRRIFLFRTKTEAESAKVAPVKKTKPTNSTASTWDVGFLDVEQTVSVDGNGKADTSGSLSVINLSMQPFGGLFLQSWLYSQRPTKKIKADVKLKDATPLDPRFVEDEIEQFAGKRVSLWVDFPPIGPGETTSLSYTLPFPIHFHEGDNSVPLHITCPHDSYSLQICFARSWHVWSPILYVGQRDRDSFQPVLVDGQTIKWNRFFPVVGQVHTLFFHLSKCSSRKSKLQPGDIR